MDFRAKHKSLRWPGLGCRFLESQVFEASGEAASAAVQSLMALHELPAGVLTGEEVRNHYPEEWDGWFHQWLALNMEYRIGLEREETLRFMQMNFEMVLNPELLEELHRYVQAQAE